MQLVELRRQGEDGGDDVVAAVGPLADAEAEAYAAQLVNLVELHPGHGLAVAVTPVQSTSGATADPAATPADLLHAALEGDVGMGDDGTAEDGQDSRN